MAARLAGVDANVSTFAGERRSARSVSRAVTLNLFQGLCLGSGASLEGGRSNQKVRHGYRNKFSMTVAQSFGTSRKTAKSP